MIAEIEKAIKERQVQGRYVPLASYPLRPYLVRRIPEAFARAHCVVPLDKDGDLLVVAAADPGDVAMLAELRRLMACDVLPLVSGRAEIQWALDRIWTPTQPPVVLAGGGSESQTERLALDLYLPWIRLERYRLVPALCSPIPRPLLERWLMVPVLVEHPHLVVACPAPPPEVVMAEVRRTMGLSPRLALCTPSAARSALEKVGGAHPFGAAPPSDAVVEQLARDGALDPARLTTIRTVSRQTGEPMEQMLVRLGMVTWQQVEEATARVLGLHRISLSRAEIDRSLLSLVPETLARRFRMLPVRGLQPGVTLAMANPADRNARELAEVLLDQTVYPALCGHTELERAIEETYAALTPRQDQSRRRPLGEYLTRCGWLTEDQVAEGIRLQRRDGRRLGECLVQLGLLDEAALAEMLALQMRAPWVNPDRHSPSPDLFELVPEDVARHHQMLPIRREGHLLTVAVADPWDRSGPESVQGRSGLEVRVAPAPASAIGVAADRYYRLKLDLITPALRGLGDWLVERGMIGRKELLEVWHHCQEKKVSFDVAMAELGFASEERIAEAIAEYTGYPRVDLRYRVEPMEVMDALGRRRQILRRLDPLDLDTARLLSEEIARVHSAIPIRRSDDGVTVAFVNPLEGDALVAIRDRLGRHVIPVIATRSELAEAIRRAFNRRVLGDLLLDADLVSRQELEEGLDLHRRTGVPLGRALLSLGHITRDQLAATLARQQGLPYFSLAGVEIDKDIARSVPEMLARRRGLLPLYRVGEAITVAMVNPRDREAVEEVQRLTGCRVDPVLTTEEELEEALERIYREDYLWQSANELMYRVPDDSAARVLSTPQKLCALAFLAISAAMLAINPVGYLTVLVGLSTIFYLSFSSYKFYLMYKALSHTLEVDVSPEEIAALTERDLPIYTVLVPLYREAEVLPTLVAAIADLDYPKAKLDVKLLLEEDDQETIEVVRKHPLPSHIKPVVVPNALPKGKPKACNYGLLHAEGELVVIYDAEDVPERDQLKKVVAAFKKADPRVDCIQAKLNYYNRDQNMLTRWFTTEYSMWFDLLIPGLDASNAPIPLGGTSNHFRTARLRELGGWDPYNVTEDADLGIRLFKAGGKTAVIDSTTFEEANSELYNWIRQRSRWVKGYIQTWLVHMRHPLKLIREIGLYQFYSFNMVVGGTFFGFLLNPVYWLLTALWFLTRWGLIQQLFPGPIFYLGAVGLYFGNFAFMYTNVAGCMRRGYYDMVKYALLSPLYWALMSVGAWKGFLQLFYRPSYWEKTKHGLYRGEINTAPATGLGDLL